MKQIQSWRQKAAWRGFSLRAVASAFLCPPPHTQAAAPVNDSLGARLPCSFLVSFYWPVSWPHLDSRTGPHRECHIRTPHCSRTWTTVPSTLHLLFLISGDIYHGFIATICFGSPPLCCIYHCLALEQWEVRKCAAPTNCIGWKSSLFGSVICSFCLSWPLPARADGGLTLKTNAFESVFCKRAAFRR